MARPLKDRLLDAARRLRRREALWAAVALIVVLGTWWLIELAEEVREGDTRTFDEWAVRSLRRADDPALPIGPEWLREVGIDLTALGSVVVTVLVACLVAGFLLLQRKYRTTLLVVATMGGGMLLNTALKYGVGRERPSVVPHLREVSTPSFPSGHAMFSAVVYLTLGLLVARIVPGRHLKAYCLGVGMLLTALVGASRVYLGVHYPTDVLAGWAAGLVWALACWFVGDFLERRRRIAHGPNSPTAGDRPPEVRP